MTLSPYEMLYEFHRTFGAGIHEEFDAYNVPLRGKLLSEEYFETLEELTSVEVDRKKLTKELADLMYVTIGTAVQFGLPLKAVFEAVHENNMSKVHPDGTIKRREDGKILKPEGFKELDLTPFFPENK